MKNPYPSFNTVSSPEKEKRHGKAIFNESLTYYFGYLTVTIPQLRKLLLMPS